MDPDDSDDTWELVRNDSNKAAEAFAKASARSLLRNDPRQALQRVTESVKYFCWRTIAKSNAITQDLEPPPPLLIGDLDTIQSTLDPKSTKDVEAYLAKKDAEASVAIAANETSITQRPDPEMYPRTIAQTLHRVFYDSTLPCDCPNREESFDLAKQHACVLGLSCSWESVGDSSHYFFQSVLAIDEKYDWKKIQFRIPRYNILLQISSILLIPAVKETIQKSLLKKLRPPKIHLRTRSS
jgi:hypothetical protein